MSDFHLIPATQQLHVEGAGDDGGIGPFEGTVIAIGFRATDPVIPANPSEPDPAVEGLLGWGTTYLLVADESQPRPCWVPKSAVTRHWVGTREREPVEV